MKRALITGINGMDGSYLAELLLEKGYEVYGMERRSSSKNRTNTSHLEGKVTFVNGDLTDQNSYKMELTGELIVKGETKTFGSNGFQKREFVIKTDDDQYPQTIKIELIQVILKVKLFLSMVT